MCSTQGKPSASFVNFSQVVETFMTPTHVLISYAFDVFLSRLWQMKVVLRAKTMLTFLLIPLKRKSMIHLTILLISGTAPISGVENMFIQHHNTKPIKLPSFLKYFKLITGKSLLEIEEKEI